MTRRSPRLSRRARHEPGHRGIHSLVRDLNHLLTLRELGRFHAWLVAAPSYLRDHPAPRRPVDLARHTCVNLAGYRYPLRLIGPRGVETVEVEGPIVANDMPLVLQLVEQGAGIGPLIVVPGDRPKLGASLVRVLPKYVVEGPRLFVASTSRKSRPLRGALLRDFLIAAYADVQRA